MKKVLLLTITAGTIFCANAQVTQINSNQGLSNPYPLSNNKAVYISDLDQTLWVTDGTQAGTIQLSATIKHVENIGSTAILNGQYIFAGTTPETGTELYVTDGTPGGTVLVRDINPGAPNSAPSADAALLNGFIYFTAETPTEGRELWRTNGTLAGTTLVKDIVTGPASSNEKDDYHLSSVGGFLLFAAGTPASGVELCRSDGTAAGTVLLADLNTGNAGADASNPRNFQQLNNILLFSATSAGAGEEVWRSDGTAAGTFQLADINPGADSATSAGIGGVNPFSGLALFHRFNGRAYFIPNTGTSTGTLWTTDGTAANTVPVKEIVGGADPSFIFLFLSANYPNKFIFSVSDLHARSELWESDGTAAGTKLFKTFAGGEEGSIPTLMVPFDLVNGNVSGTLFQGNKFFFMASTQAEGQELWISDGVDSTAAHTFMVEDINPGPESGLEALSYIYTSTGIYFPANNGVNGAELWKSDGTPAGTDMVADIFAGPNESDPQLNFYLVNNKILFEADNGDGTPQRDLYAVDGVFTALPITLGDFTVQLRTSDAHLQWYTLQELNSKDFTLQRSFDGLHFQELAKIPAAGNSTTRKAYSHIDVAVGNSGQQIAYYRLIATDVDGETSTSPVIALRIGTEGPWTVCLLANPIPGDLEILLTGVKDNIQLAVVDVSGRKLMTTSRSAVNGRVSLPTSNLPKGMYVLIAESGKERKAIPFLK